MVTKNAMHSKLNNTLELNYYLLSKKKHYKGNISFEVCFAKCF